MTDNRRWTDENASPEPQEPLVSKSSLEPFSQSLQRGCVSLHDTNCDMVNANFCAPGHVKGPRQRQCIATTTPRPANPQPDPRGSCHDEYGRTYDRPWTAEDICYDWIIRLDRLNFVDNEPVNNI